MVRAGRATGARPSRPKSSCAYIRTFKERPYPPLPCDVPTSLKLLLYTQTDTQPIAYRKAVLAVRFPVLLALDDCPALLPTSACVEAASPGRALTLNERHISAFPIPVMLSVGTAGNVISHMVQGLHRRIVHFLCDYSLLDAWIIMSQCLVLLRTV